MNYESDPDKLEFYEERSAVFQFEHGHPREYAEWLALQMLMKKFMKNPVGHMPYPTPTEQPEIKPRRKRR